MHMDLLCKKQNTLFMHYLRIIHGTTTTLLKKIKDGSHDTIYLYKNYFATVFSVFSF